MSQLPESDDRPGVTRRWIRAADKDNVPVRSILLTIGLVVLVYLGGLVLYRLRALVLLLLVGSFLALLLNPLVLGLQRMGLRRRGAAVAVVGLFTLVCFVGLAFAFGYPLINALTHLANSLPGYVRQAQSGQGWLGHLMMKYHVETWISHNSAKLVAFAQGLSKPALALGQGAVSALIALLTVFTFVILVLLEAPRLRIALLASMTSSRRARLERISHEVSRSATRYMLGNLVTSLIAGLVVFIDLALLHVPFAPLWALWVGLVDFLPTIGGALAGIPVVLFALGHSTTAGVITFIIFLVYTQLENHVLNPVIMSRTVRINPLSVFMGVLVGAEVGAWVGGLFGGFVGVLLAVPMSATVQTLVREVRRPTLAASEFET